ncbi:MAG: hypothetical protein WD737_13400 [Gemmatimonadota bacterium]
MMTIAATIQAAEAAGTSAPGIGPGALAFMLISMGLVTGLLAWCLTRVLGTKQHFDPDGTGPAQPPVPGEAEQKDGG